MHVRFVLHVLHAYMNTCICCMHGGVLFCVLCVWMLLSMSACVYIIHVQMQRQQPLPLLNPLLAFHFPHLALCC